MRTLRQVPAWLWVLLLVLLLKGLLLAADPHLRFFFGDSEAYLHAATRGWGKPDRSSTYPFLLWLLVFPTGSLATLAWLQTLAGVLACMLVYALLRTALGVQVRWAALGTAAVAVEPMQLFYERSVMAECFGTLALLAMVGCLATYFRRAHARWLLFAACCGIAAASFRMNLLPVVLVAGAGAPLCWSFATRERRPGFPVCVLHLAVALASTWVLHAAYRSAYGMLAQVPPAYLADQGLLQLGWVAPLLEPRHLEQAGVPGRLLDELPVSHLDPRAREWQLWHPQGLIARLRRARPADASTVAGAISRAAIAERPARLAGLAWGNLLDHFDVSHARQRLQNDLGEQPPSAAFVERWRRELGYDASDWRHAQGWVYRWFAASRPALGAMLVLAFVLAAGALRLAWRERSPVSALMAFVLLGLAASYLIFTHALVYRYLHALAPVFVSTVALLADRLTRAGLVPQRAGLSPVSASPSRIPPVRHEPRGIPLRHGRRPRASGLPR